MCSPSPAINYARILFYLLCPEPVWPASVRDTVGMWQRVASIVAFLSEASLQTDQLPFGRSAELCKAERLLRDTEGRN